MAYEKVVHAQLAGLTLVGSGSFAQRLNEPTAATGSSSMRLALVGFTSNTGGTSAGSFLPNPFKGTLFWDDMNYYLTGVSLTAGTSFVVRVESDAVDGYTGLPIARAVLSLTTTGNVRMTKDHRIKGSVLPTHVNVIRTVGTSGSMTCKLWGTGKASRGNLSTGGGKGKGADRVLQGDIFNSRRNITANNLAIDGTFTITANGASASFQGLDKMALWDQAAFWFVGGQTVTGSWQAGVVGTVDGSTYMIAETTALKLNGTSDAYSHPFPAVALESYYGGVCPRPTALILTEVDASASGISDTRVVVVAKSNRGEYR